MWQPGWKMTTFVGLMLPLLLSLGFWQVDRGAWKRQMESAYLDRLTSLPVTPGAAQAWPDFTRLKLSGHFGDEVFLVDNQVLDGKTGYWVVQSFRTQATTDPVQDDPVQDDPVQGDPVQGDQSARVLLVNRGFVPAPSRREQLPEIDPVDGQVQVTGVVWPFTGLIPVLDEDIWPAGWPKRVQRLDVQRMAQLIDATAVEIRLEEGPWARQPAPFAAVLSDAKHRGYAATWFGLALALVVLYGIWGVKNARQTN